MRALQMTEYGGRLAEVDVPPPAVPDDAALVRVTATGVCRSDWHAWRGHDASVPLPHVPGHEFAGVVERVGPAVTGWRGGERVTAPFVQACGSCPTCRAGRWSTCPHQQQPGFERPGTWAEHVVVRHADTNLVALPESVDDVTAAALGCRFATAYRALVTLGRVAAGEHVLVIGCGGVGLAAVQVATAYGAQVVAVDPSAPARELAARLGAGTTLSPGPDLLDRVRDTTAGGPHLSVDALGAAHALATGIAALRPGGRHVQVGLLLGEHAMPRVDMGRVIGQELQVLGSHGMGAAEYAPMLADIAAGRLAPAELVGRVGGLDLAGPALAAMDGPAGAAGTTVLVPGLTPR